MSLVCDQLYNPIKESKCQLFNVFQEKATITIAAMPVARVETSSVATIVQLHFTSVAMHPHLRKRTFQWYGIILK